MLVRSEARGSGCGSSSNPGETELQWERQVWGNSHSAGGEFRRDHMLQGGLRETTERPYGMGWWSYSDSGFGPDPGQGWSYHCFLAMAKASMCSVPRAGVVARATARGKQKQKGASGWASRHCGGRKWEVVEGADTWGAQLQGGQVVLGASGIERGRDRGQGDCLPTTVFPPAAAFFATAVG